MNLPWLLAYLDPGAGSMLLQLLLAGFAASGVVLKFYWNRLRSYFASRPADDAPPPDSQRPA